MTNPRCTHDDLRFGEGTFFLFCAGEHGCGATWMAIHGTDPLKAQPDFARSGVDPNQPVRTIDRSVPQPSTKVSASATARVAAERPRALRSLSDAEYAALPPLSDEHIAEALRAGAEAARAVRDANPSVSISRDIRFR